LQARLVRRPTVLAVASERVDLVEEGAGGGNIVQQAFADQLVLQRLEVLLPRHTSGDGVKRRQVGVIISSRY
jgi:hypothetical protein